MEIPKKTSAELTADRVRADILSGRLAPGSALPGERGLSETLGVSRLTLRSALTRLESEGLVEPVRGSGTRVLDYREHGGVDLLGYLAEQSLAGGQIPLRLIADLLEMRRMIAVELLGTVAVRASDAELDELGRQLRALDGALLDPADFVREDLAFARLVVRASRNLALELLFNTTVRVIATHPGVAVAFRANAEQTLRVYARLLELVRTRDERRVRRVARRLIGGMDRRTLERIDAFVRASSSEGAS